MASQSSFEIDSSGREEIKSDDKGVTTARSKTLLKIGSATENNGIVVESFSNDHLYDKHNSEKDEDWNIGPNALSTSELPGQKLSRLQSMHKAEKEVENVGKNIDLRERITKSNRIYLSMK
jgi:hypothetical protein